MYLKEFINNSDIKSLPDLTNFAVESGYLSRKLDGLVFDHHENRLFGESLILENKVFEFEFIKIKNSTQISIINCIFLGSLIIIDNSGPVKIYIDNSIIADDLRFYGCCVNQIELNDCNIKRVYFYNCQVNTSYMSFCTIGSLTFDEAQIDKFQTFCNKIYFIEKYRSNIKEFNLNSDDVESENIIKNKPSKDINLLNFVNISIDETFANLNDPIETRIETIHFLKKSPSLYNNKSLELLANVQLSILSYNNRIIRFIIWLLQGFTKPLLFITYAFTVILIFAFIYWELGSLDNDGKFVSFLQALYFSGTTFTTIGYGDIRPVGFTRAIAIIEGFIGILLSSAILVSMVNRFTKDK